MQLRRSPWTHWKLWEVGQAAVLRQTGCETTREAWRVVGQSYPFTHRAAFVCVLGS